MHWFCLVTFIFLASQALGNEVVRVNGRKVGLVLSAKEIAVGSILSTVSSEKEPSQQAVTIKKISGKKAIGMAFPGVKLKKGDKLVLLDSPSESKESPVSLSELRGLSFSYAPRAYAFRADLGVRGSTQLHGSGQGLQVEYLGNILSGLQYRVSLGYQLATTSGVNLCAARVGDSPRCEFNFNAVSVDAWLSYALSLGSRSTTWLGLGAQALVPLSLESNLIDQTTVGILSPILIGGGWVYRFGKSSFLPVRLEYGFLPPSRTFSGSFMGLSLGYLYAF